MTMACGPSFATNTVVIGGIVNGAVMRTKMEARAGNSYDCVAIRTSSATGIVAQDGAPGVPRFTR
jgi:hypothetical protein